MLGLLLIAGTTWLGGSMLNTSLKRDKAWQRAQELCGEKGIINIGSGSHRQGDALEIANDERVKVNVDITPGEPKGVVADLEQASLPFSDKEFDVAVAFHILEHLHNWQAALEEMIRVADHVVVAVPHPLALTGYLHPQHVQFFSLAQMQAIRDQYPEVEVYA